MQPTIKKRVMLFPKRQSRPFFVLLHTIQNYSNVKLVKNIHLSKPYYHFKYVNDTKLAIEISTVCVEKVVYVFISLGNLTLILTTVEKVDTSFY